MLLDVCGGVRTIGELSSMVSFTALIVKFTPFPQFDVLKTPLVGLIVICDESKLRLIVTISPALGGLDKRTL